METHLRYKKIVRHRRCFLLGALSFIICHLSFSPAGAQELQARININHSKIQGTDASVFENLQQTLEQFVNERQWTDLQFQKNERIACNFNITVDKSAPPSSRLTVRFITPPTPPPYIIIRTRTFNSTSCSSTS